MLGEAFSLRFSRLVVVRLGKRERVREREGGREESRLEVGGGGRHAHNSWLAHSKTCHTLMPSFFSYFFPSTPRLH